MSVFQVDINRPVFLNPVVLRRLHPQGQPNPCLAKQCLHRLAERSGRTSQSDQPESKFLRLS